MLSLVGKNTEPSDSAAWKIDINLQAWRQQQAREQRETALSWLDAAISVVCGSDGEKHPAKLRRRYSVKASVGTRVARESFGVPHAQTVSHFRVITFQGSGHVRGLQNEAL